MKKQSIKYTNKVVFFLDILGFRSIIEEKTPKEIKDLFKNIEWHLNENVYNFSHKSPSIDVKTSKQVTHFSDSVIISFDYNDPSQLFFTLRDILLLQINLVYVHDVLLRGACSIGKMYHDKQSVFGPAVNRAYSLENEISLYPRVVIDNNIIDVCSKYSAADNDQKEEMSYIYKILKQDKDRHFFIDYISYDSNRSEMDDDDEWYRYMIKLREIIETGLKIEDKKIRRKHLWLKKKYNKTLTAKVIKTFNSSREIPLGKINL